MEDIKWNIVGKDTCHVKFSIPINPPKKWWEFWKKDLTEKESIEFLNKIKDSIKFGNTE